MPRFPPSARPAARSAIPERARGTERLRERDLLGRERSGLGLRAESELREGRIRAPRDHRARAAQAGEEIAGGEEVVKRRRGTELGQP
jgi:hypothetical protein